jgi:O-antigen/teichoic acid export membrane protein
VSVVTHPEGQVEEIRADRPRHRHRKRKRVPLRLLSQGGWSLIVATTGVSGLSFLFHLLISRLLGPPQYGAFSAVLNIISILAVPLGAVQLAVTQAVVAGAGTGRVSLRSLTIKAALWGTAAMVVIEALSPLTNNFLSLNSPFADLAMAAWIPVAVVGAVLQGALLGEMRFVPVAIGTFIGGGALRLASGVVLVSAGFGLAGAVAATVIGQAFTTGVFLLVARREVFARRLNPVRISLRDTVLSIGALAGATTLGGMDVFLARHFLAHLAAGYYAAGATAGHIALFLPGAVATVAFPRLVAAARTGVGIGKTLTETLGLVTAIGLVTFAVLATMPRFVVDVLFGQKYAAAASIVGVIGLASVLLGVISVVTYFYVARRSLAALSSWIGVVLVWVLVALVHGGMAAVAWCMLASSAAVLIVMSLPALAAIARRLSAPSAPALDEVELPPAEIDFSLVIPFYNPGSRLAAHVRDVTRVLHAARMTFEVIAVSDGSTDGSPASIAGIGQVRVVLLNENQGKGAALRVGLAQGRGRYLGFIDGDGDIPAGQLSQFLAATRTGDPDVVLGTKRHPDSDVVYPPVRRLYSWGYQQLNRVLFQLPTRDTQTGIKLIRRETLAAVLPKMVEKRFAFDLELLVVSRRLGYCNFVELPVRITERFTSTISVKSVWGMLLDTFAIFYRLRILRFYGSQRVPLAGLSQPPVVVPEPRLRPTIWPREDAALAGPARVDASW